MLSFSSPLSVTSDLLNFLNNHTGAMAMCPPTLNKIGTTSMHSSRIRTALFGGRHYMSVPGVFFRKRSPSRGISVWGVSAWGISVQGGLHPEWRPPPAVNRITDRCKNITFPQLRWRAVKITSLVFYTLGIKCLAYNLIRFKAYS